MVWSTLLMGPRSCPWADRSYTQIDYIIVILIVSNNYAAWKHVLIAILAVEISLFIIRSITSIVQESIRVECSLLMIRWWPVGRIFVDTGIDLVRLSSLAKVASFLKDPIVTIDRPSNLPLSFYIQIKHYPRFRSIDYAFSFPFNLIKNTFNKIQKYQKKS